MTMEDKKGLLERYKTEGGLKNLQWVNEYFETVTETTEQKDVAESGWMTPGQIFTLNGLSWEQTEEKKRDKMLAALLKECWDECGIDKPDECTKAHALPELSKYWYSKQKHVLRTTRSSSRWRQPGLYMWGRPCQVCTSTKCQNWIWNDKLKCGAQWLKPPQGYRAQPSSRSPRRTNMQHLPLSPSPGLRGQRPPKVIKDPEGHR